MTDKTIPYDQFFSLRPKYTRQFGSLFDLPVAAPPYAYLAQTYAAQYPSGRVLDFGCGASKPLQAVLGIDDAHYHTCDDDASGSFTYTRIDDIPAGAQYDLIAANQVFEHIPFRAAIEVAARLGAHVAPGGIFQIGVPNPQHPIRQQASPDHLTAWGYMDLCALLELAGLEPFYCARTNKYPGPRWYERPLVNWIAHRYRMDWCDTIYVVGRRKP